MESLPSDVPALLARDSAVHTSSISISKICSYHLSLAGKRLSRRSATDKFSE